MTRPDMSKRDFNLALARHGIKRDHLGYYRINDDGHYVYAGNAGPRKRDQLAYLLKKQAEADAA